MAIAKIHSHLCDRSPMCPAARSCPIGAITQEKFGAASKVDEKKCLGCEKCLRFCPAQAIEMV